jgi:hypothetical protein
MDASAYFSALRAEQNRLEKLYPTGFLYIVSIKNLNANSTGGTVTEVSTRQAATHFCAATARIAEPGEVADFHAQAKAFSARMATQSFNRKKSDSSGVTFTLTK